MNINKLILIIFIASSFFSCQKKSKFDQYPIYPQIQSTTKSISVSSLIDDHHFSESFEGVKFDGRDYRTLYKKRGEITFDLLEPEAISIVFNLQSSKDHDISFILNNNRAKTYPLLKKNNRILKLLFKKEQVNKGKNTIRIINDGNQAPLKFYKIQIEPLSIRTREKSDSQLTPISTPAHLTYYLKPEIEYFYLEFDKKVPQLDILIKNSDLNLEIIKSNTHKIKLDLTGFKTNITTLHIEIKSPKPISLQILRSFYTKKILPTNPKITQIKDKLIKSRDKFNIIMILLDSARADKFSCYGYPRETTPNIDKIAQTALVYQHFFSEASYTLASTGSLFSGLAPDYHNAVTNFYGGLNLKISTLAEILKKKGFLTAAVSGIPYCSKTYNMDQGFSHFIELFNQETQAYSDQFIPHVKDILNRASKENKRFFLYLHIREPHIDYIMKPPFFGKYHQGYSAYPNPEFLKKLKEIYFSTEYYQNHPYSKEDIQLLRDSYDENLASADHTVGDITSILRKSDLSNNTILIILADHGEGLYEHQQIGHNKVLYREGMNIPLIIYLPGITQERIDVWGFYSTTDLTASLIKTFSLDLAPNYLNKKGIFKKKSEELLIGRSIFFNRFYPHYELCDGSNKAIIKFPFSKESILLFDIQNDPWEESPLSSEKLKNYFYFRLQNFFKDKGNISFRGEESKPSPEEIKALKSLGYL